MKELLIVCLLVLMAVAFGILISSPGCQKTHKQPPDVVPSKPVGNLDRLRLPWDSEAQADWPMSEVLVSMSQIAYQPAEEATVSYRKLGFDRVVPIAVGSMAAFVVFGEDVAVIAFRGT